MQREYFWGAELSKLQTVSKWSPERGSGDDGLEHILELKQAVLGAKATAGGRNIVEVTTNTFEGNSVKQPILSLELGKNDACSMNLTFRAPATFKLIKGSGPVYLAGTHVLELEDVSAMDSSYLEGEAEEESSDDDEMEDASPDLKKSKKRPANTPQTGKSKKVAKLDLSKTSTEGDEDSSEEEDSDDESTSDLDEENSKKLLAGLADADSDDSDDSDFDGDSQEESEEEGDSDEGEEDDEEDESDESDEEVVIPTAKKGKGKPQVNGKPGSAKKTETAKPEAKTPTSKGGKKEKDTPKGTPKSIKKYNTLEEIKSDIVKSPAMPKKNTKFENWVRNKYKVEDKEKISELWTWHQKTNLKQ
ncbi:nucleoplasmin-like protein ANO39 [Saccoglossus kowalevskii]|uniref:Nucleoplasmin-like protein ANO39-like isoform X1 n=1 Tax=Saccoglossus kowalevskii TaxID=10224 RepID=A0ABM0GTN4_SACKO|nr:PREDICTED: nucleoplasmin-like protein ANO39-like isoform X1 [Saccoglossus kowalevskii]